MKVTIENIKGLNKDVKVLIDKETMNSHMDEKYEEIKSTVNLKGFRPGKVPKEVLKRQFGKAVFGEVLDKVLKDTSAKALEENKIKPAGQPKLDLKTYGEDKELEYVMSVTELPKVETKSLESIKFDEYSVKIDDSETDKRIKEIAKNQPSFKEASPETKAKEGDLVTLDYNATIDGKEFKGSEGKNTQLTLGKDLFLKGFDKQLIGAKKDDEKIVEATLPENFPEKELVNKKAKFVCKILNVKNPEDVKINDDFAKNLGAKDLNDLKTLISKQINDEYKNSLDQLAKNQILKEIEKIKIDEIPENLIEGEIKILSQGMSEDEAKKNKAKFTETAKTRIKTGLILNEFGEQNKIQVSEQEIQAEVQKQLRMMPGQEKMVMDFYQKNPSAVASLRGTVYEEKILNLIKEKAKPNKKEISKAEAEKILKEAHNHDHNHDTEAMDEKKETKKEAKPESDEKKKPSAKSSKSKPVAKKVSKK
ncbi:trigger factor [Candidatus Pelagibacter sp. HTCC7211]|uniref:trigger factor n=1 Tax=Pelagibacter sp. (strain HTCC7211) TaxID=439493 RepID=UPI0001839E4C|nr:trigger factor [Candidatus Pelagibacter sp. HTCC7211]EDZ59916.1 trigger factor [Candidatus Pelagibacter sp. HTCC7211]MBD1151556.1 trigger factor [Pelagibacterales bacterium SAG-MED25]